VIRVSREAAHELGAIAAALARGEGLTAHAKSAEYRMKQSTAKAQRRKDNAK
jgi:histidinol dehydrogenase